MESLFLERWQAFLRYIDLPGAGPARVYLHGLGGAAATYTRVATHPSLAGHRAILVDFLGCGFSDRPDDFRYTLEDHAQTIAALLDRLALSGCVVIGHSMGGSVAITLAALRPDLVGRLAVAEALLDPGGKEVSRRIAAQSEESFCRVGYHALVAEMRDQAIRGETLAAVVAGTMGVSAPHALYRSAVGLVQGTRPTMRERLLRLPIPRAYLFGERSLPDPDADDLPARGVQVLVVSGAGHGMMWDNPSGFVAALRSALAS